jgi:hypothetical protein
MALPGGAYPQLALSHALIWSSRLPKPPKAGCDPRPHWNPVFGVISGLRCRRRRQTGAER